MTVIMEQLKIPLHEGIPEGYLPCSHPELVGGYVAIEEILDGVSTDFALNQFGCECERVLCEHALDEKREDNSYSQLLEHFRNGGMINKPVSWRETGVAGGRELWEGHHRMVAALDAGFTHVPYLKRRSDANWGDDWEEHFTLVSN